MATNRSGMRQFGSSRHDTSGEQQVRGAELDLAALERQLADLKASHSRTAGGRSAAKPWWLPRTGR